MRTEVFESHSVSETVALGKQLADSISVPGVVILTGDLGAGKTTIIKGIAEGYQAAREDDVSSPTFTLIHEYRGPKVTVYHIDLYRIDTLRELESLAIDDLRDDRSLILLEWGEKFDRFVKERDAEIRIERTGENDRRISLTTR